MTRAIFKSACRCSRAVGVQASACSGGGDTLKRELQQAALAASGVPQSALRDESAHSFGRRILRWSELTFAATEAVLVLIY
jgi:hypothetical protein